MQTRRVGTLHSFHPPDTHSSRLKAHIHGLLSLCASAGLERDELLARIFQAAGQSFGRPPSGLYLSRPSDSLASTPKAVPSPPPPYTPTPTIHAAHTTEMKGAPPSYTQAVQAALLAKEHAKKLNERYAMQHRHGHATQSFEAAAYAGRGPGTATLRTATSVPTFKNYGSPSFGAAGAACGCSKCQVSQTMPWKVFSCDSLVSVPVLVHLKD